LPLLDAIHDTFRVNFYKEYISNLYAALTEDKVNVKAYFAWSLMDNFEWCDGYSVRFGMTYVDYKTQNRYIKDSLYWFSQFIKTKKIDGEFYNEDIARLKALQE
jgi:beta-glucosidase/6-phospho-beta-glucosidase/beta-galactosidase